MAHVAATTTLPVLDCLWLEKLQHTLAKNSFKTSKSSQPHIPAKEAHASFSFKPFTRHTVAQHGEGRALIPKTAKMFTEAKFERLEQTGSAHSDLSLNRQALSEAKPTTSPLNFVFLLALHVQCCVAAQENLCHLPILQEEGDFVAGSMQPYDEKRLITHFFFTRAARQNRGTTVRLPGILLVHHVQTDQGTCFHCFHWNAGPKPNQLPDDHRLFLQKEKEELAVRPYFSGTFQCVEAVRSRTLSQASRKGHRTSSQNGCIRPDTTLLLAIAALLPQGLEPTLILVFHAL